jgi:hypothetical protein
MPIISIIFQPASLSIRAAYRPTYFVVSATRTNGNPAPPVVFCDVYVNDVYYKTLSKTHPSKRNDSNTEWSFDIQDACQELIGKVIGTNGGFDVQKIDDLFKIIYCRFRSSGYDINPTQGTGNVIPVSGTGTQSVSFYLLNATLQHTSRQELPEHLNTYKNRNWDSITFPLSHRPNSIKLGTNKSDHFPVFTQGSDITSFRPMFRVLGGTTYSDTVGGVPAAACAPVGLPAYSFPSSQVGVAYTYEVLLTGDAPFGLVNISKPAWLLITLAGNKITFSGTPNLSGPSFVTLGIKNCSGTNIVHITGSIPVAAQTGGCVPVAIPNVSINNGQVGVDYAQNFQLSGDAPFVLSNIVSPTWMVVGITGSTVNLTGRPTASGNSIPFSFTATNCSGVNSDNFSNIFNVIPASTSCIAVMIPAGSLPAAQVNMPYSYSIALSGDAPFSISNIVAPTWLTITLSGKNVNFTGTPTSMGSSVPVSFTLKNCSDANTANFNGSLNVIASADNTPFVINNSGTPIQITSDVFVYPNAPTTGNFSIGINAGTTIFISSGNQTSYLVEFRTSIGNPVLYSQNVTIGEYIFLSSDPNNINTGVRNINYITIT